MREVSCDRADQQKDACDRPRQRKYTETFCLITLLARKSYKEQLMPLLWIRRVSDGHASESYTLQVPFQLGPIDSLKDLENCTETSIDGLKLRIAENYGLQLLRVSGFTSQAQAQEYWTKVYGALLRLTVVKQLSLRTISGWQWPTLYDPPIKVTKDNPFFGDLMEDIGWTHVDGYVETTPSVVIPEHLRIFEAGGGSVKVTRCMPAKQFLDELLACLQFPVEKIPLNNRLSLAIDLYASSLWESTRAAQVINLSTTLEALLKPEKVPPFIGNHIDAILRDWDDKRNHSEESQEEREELNRLRDRLKGLRQESISRCLRSMIAAHSNVLGENEKEAARNVSYAYSVRSKLIHEGDADVQDIKRAANWLNKSVPKILKACVDGSCTGTE